MQTAIADYHMHSTISPDGHDSMEAMCLAAIQMGLQEIVFTDHYEFFYPEISDNPFSKINWEHYFQKFNRCREQFSPKLRIRAGVEMGQSYLNLAAEQAFLHRFSFDFVLGSVHKLDNLDLGAVDYRKMDLNSLCLANLEKLYLLADQCDFDCMSHFDLIKRYAAYDGIKVDLMVYREQVTRIFQRLIERGKGIEINTSGLRQAAKETLPSLSLLKLYRSLGGELLTIGSDAHRTEDVAKDLNTALELAKQAGFKQLTLFKTRTPHFISI